MNGLGQGYLTLNVKGRFPGAATQIAIVHLKRNSVCNILFEV
jgi:hypothetical protein